MVSKRGRTWCIYEGKSLWVELVWDVPVLSVAWSMQVRDISPRRAIQVGNSWVQGACGMF